MRLIATGNKKGTAIGTAPGSTESNTRKNCTPTDFWEADKLR